MNKIVIAPTVVLKNQNFVGIGEVLLFANFNNSIYPGESRKYRIQDPNGVK